MRRLLLTMISAGMVFSTAVPAQAIFFVGECHVRVSFHFEQPVGLSTLSRDYTLEINGLASPACVTTEAFDQVGRSTWGNGMGDSTIWSCGAAFSSGIWNQNWRKPNGLLSPPSFNGFHRVLGTWGAWTIELDAPNPVNFLGAIELTLDPLTAASATSQCASGTLRDLHMVGVQVFQDPTIPPSS